MFEFLIPMLFGWPMIIIALTSSLAGLLFNRWQITLLGGVLFLLPAWYMAHYTAIAYLAPAGIFASAYFVAKQNSRLAFLFWTPALFLSAFLGIIVLTQ